jgi:hypothetical protein
MGADGAQAPRVVVIAEVGNHALPHSNADGLALLGVRACRQTDGRTDGRTLGRGRPARSPSTSS